MATTYDNTIEFMTDILSNFNTIHQEVNGIIVSCEYFEFDDTFNVYENGDLIYNCDDEQTAMERFNLLTYLAKQDGKSVNKKANWYLLTGVVNDVRIDFDCKSDAFKYLNETPHELDNMNLFCNSDLRYVKNNIGIFDQQFQVYLKAPLETDFGVIGEK